MQLSKLLACKMQPGDKLGHTCMAKFKSLSSDMQASELTHAQLMVLIYLSTQNDESGSVATYFGVMRPSSLTLNKVANMVYEHTDTLLAGVDQGLELFAGALHNSGNIVCQYCKKSGHMADKCFAIANLKNEPKSDNSGSSSKYINGGGSGKSKKPHHKPKKNTFSVKIGGISILAAHSAASSLLDRPVLSSSLCQVYLHTMFKAL
ncbi:hypothetical protein GGI03_003734 [Coemansia sp. RSA 2337]|nr:hypothetical protein H4S04_005216 [Coemansia sp. S16]KAJ2111372.1 hypothetical protein IW146_005400 [Coemansia sp. RSA 922]KAJ2349608.1 hypothetical protein GGH92_002484 [Coemansia sp. RSA 2673]KAJ2463607.1 hypothetical protein GGI03_003734 [Coemansia sp. RSA 2337]